MSDDKLTERIRFLERQLFEANMVMDLLKVARYVSADTLEKAIDIARNTYDAEQAQRSEAGKP